MAARRDFTPYLQNADTVFLRNIQLLQHFPAISRVGRYLYSEKALFQLIFSQQFCHRRVRLFFVLSLAFLSGKNPFRQRYQNNNTDRDTHKPHRGEREKRQGFQPGVYNSFLNDQVGRSTYKRKHPPHTAGKGQRHKQTRRRHIGTIGQTYHNRQHQSYRTGIAHKCPDKRCYQHDQYEKKELILPGRPHDFSAYHFGQSRLENRTSYDKQPDHHDNDTVGKSAQSFCRSKNIK